MLGQDRRIWPQIVTPTLDQIRRILETYDYEVVKGCVEPGDVVVSRKTHFHLNIVGPNNQLWSARIGSGVQPLGLILEGRIRVFRPDKSRW